VTLDGGRRNFLGILGVGLCAIWRPESRSGSHQDSRDAPVAQPGRLESPAIRIVEDYVSLTGRRD
jgi:hypothetical protein